MKIMRTKTFYAIVSASRTDAFLNGVLCGLAMALSLLCFMAAYRTRQL